jgi:hypothetical protein
MPVYNTQLLCTFAKQQTYLDVMDRLSEYYEISDSKVYVLQSGLNSDDILLTFNVKKTDGEFYPNTISVHRKKEYNIIYSINALNELIKMENNGVMSKSHQIAWDNYRNCFISARDGKVKITPTKLLKIFKIN